MTRDVSAAARAARLDPTPSLARFLIILGYALAATALPARAAEADRIVSLGGAVTEIIYALGAQDRIVALDTTSLYPPKALKEKPHVGYLRQLSAEGILSTRPDLVIALAGAGPPEALQLVENARTRVAHIADDPTPAGVTRKIEAVASLLGRERKGEALARDTAERFAALDRERGEIGPKRRALFILSVQNGRVLVGGRGTTADGMLTLAGAENAASAVAGYKPMTDEAILAAAPDLVVMMSQGPGGAPSPDLLKGPALSQTPAGRDGRLIVMDGLYLLGFGPRTPQAAHDLMRAIYSARQAE